MLTPITTPERVGNFLAVDVSDLDEIDEQSLLQACDDATAVVCDFLMRDSITTLADEVQASVVFVATKIAARIYRNPNELTTDNLGEATHTYVDPRILTLDEKNQLRRARSQRVVRGPIQTLGMPSA